MGYCIHQLHQPDGAMVCESDHLIMSSRIVSQDFCNRCPVRNREQLGRSVPQMAPPAHATATRCVRRGGRLRRQLCNIGCLSGRIEFNVYQCSWDKLPGKYNHDCADHRYHTRVMPCNPACDGYQTNAGAVLTADHVCGITAPPRYRATTQQTIDNVRAAGIKAEIHQGPGVWSNWIATLKRLYDTHPEAERIAIFQDDLLIAPGAAEYLLEEPWPGEDCGAVSLYLPHCYESKTAHRTGWKRIDTHDRQYLVGAVAFVFPRWLVARMLAHPLSTAKYWRGCATPQGWIDDDHSKVAVDTWVGEMLRTFELFAYYHSPSLVQHVGKNSTHCKRDLTGNRRCSQWAGDDVSAANNATGNATAEPIDVVIPAHELPNVTINALRHLRLFCDVPFHVVYVDNGSTAGTIQLIVRYAQLHGIPCTVIASHSNQGFTAAVNLGLRASAGRHVLVLNNDCFVGPRCCRSLLKEINLGDRVAAAGPVTDDRGQQSIARANGPYHNCGLEGPIETINGQTTHDYVRYISRRLQRKHSARLDMAAFFCTLLHRDALADVGELSGAPEYASGLGADDEWCRRARDKGWTIQLVHDAFASHMHSETFRYTGQNRRKLQKIALNKFYKDAVK